MTPPTRPPRGPSPGPANVPPLAQHDSSRLWNVGLLIANLLVFGFTLKLYTEFFKARDARP